jgi:glycosyltransferase involved in cell wall biosynthesis
MVTAGVDRQTGSDARQPRTQPEGTLRISVIVPVHNGALMLPRCLESLSRSEYSTFEVIVVDDCSNDTTPQIIERFGARYVRTPQNLGPGGARNLGAGHAQGDILAFVDADVVLPPNGLCLIAEDFRSDPDLAAVFGSYDDEPAWATFISQYKNLMHHYVHQISSESVSTFWAGCGAVRKSVFDEFGGFDGATYTAPSIEDIALGLELARHGRKIRIDKRLTAKHLKRWTVRSLLRADIFYRAVPWSRLILNTRHLPRELNLNYAARLSSPLVALFASAGLLLPFTLLHSARWMRVPLLVTMATVGLVLLLLNRDVYLFFLRKRGWWFAARAVLAHWAYYLYSGVTFFLVAAMHLVRSTFSFARKPNAKHISP